MVLRANYCFYLFIRESPIEDVKLIRMNFEIGINKCDQFAARLPRTRDERASLAAVSQLPQDTNVGNGLCSVEGEKRRLVRRTIVNHNDFVFAPDLVQGTRAFADAPVNERCLVKGRDDERD